MQSISPQLLAHIGRIYDCVIDPERWAATLDRVRLDFRMHNVGIGVLALPSGLAVVQLTVGIPEPYASRLPLYADDIPTPWGGMAAFGNMALEEPHVQTRVLDHSSAAWKESRYVREWIEPQGIIDAILVILAHDRTTLATLAFGRHGSQGPILDADVEGFRLLTPHIRRAVAISRLLDEAVARANTFAAALDATSAGVVLVDAALNVVHANASAERMLAVGDPLVTRGGRLSLRLEIVPGGLEAAVSIAGQDDVVGRKGLGIPTRTLDGRSVVLHVLPLERREQRRQLPPSATAAIFVAEAAAPLQLPSDAMAILYELTPAETRIVDLLLTGQPLPEIARRLGNSANTVRTHLKRIFEKTGCHRQTDLVALARNISLPA